MSRNFRKKTFQAEIASRRPLQKASVLVIALSIILAALVPRLIYFSHMKANPYYDGTAETSIIGLDQRNFIERAKRILDEGLIGRGAFPQAPLYDYYMALVFKLFGPSVPAMRLVQLFMGAFACGLIFWIGREVYGTRTGVIAGLLAAFYPVSIYYDWILLRSAFAAQINLLLLMVLLLACRTRNKLWWLAGGFFLGLSCLVQANAIVFTPFLLAWIWFGCRGEPAAQRCKMMVLLLVGLGLIGALLAGRNLAAGAPLLHVDSQGPFVFYVGNAADALGNGYKIPPSYADVPHDHLVASALRSAWQNPGDYLKLTGRKIAAFFNGFETPNNMSFYLFQEYSWVLRNPLLSFALLSPLGILGMLLSLRRSTQSMLIAFFVIAGSLSVILFYILSRFRYPLTYFFIILSAYAVSWFWDHLKLREFKKAGLIGALFIPLAAATATRPFTYGFISPHDLYNTGLAYSKINQDGHALECFQRALKIDARFEPAQSSIYFLAGKRLVRENRYGEAAAAFKEALGLMPGDTGARDNYLIAVSTYLVQQHRYAEAAEAIRQIVDQYPGNDTAKKNLAYCLHMLGDVNKKQ
ncbi:MAG: glycosyltransferase family 39 protein [Pseudomonadota bacterium]